MSLTDILIFALAAPAFMWLVPAQHRQWGLFIASIGAIGWLQYQASSAYAAFELIALAVLVTALVWWIIQPSTETSPERGRQDRYTLLVLSGLLFMIWLAIGLDRGGFAVMTVAIGSVMTGAGVVGLQQVFPPRSDSPDVYKSTASIAIILIVVILFGLKIPQVAEFLGAWFAAENANVSPLAWLGFSYVAFRLISLLRDYQYGRLPEAGYSLRDVMTYVLFFPAFTAGPIDQAQRFVPDLQAVNPLDANRFMDGTMRIAIGVFKKFVIADSLARISLSLTLVERTDTALGLWLLVYIYAFQIFFDFSGYSDVAIGLGKLYGITLPENFDRPYLQPNLQQFWNRWHITLSMWFRSYYFSPLSRALLRRERKFPTDVNVFIAQVSTMVLIGLWHGVTLNFVVWGLWHGVGLFIFKFTSDRTRRWHRRVTQRVAVKRGLYVLSVLLTFHFVAIGWVFFALPDASVGVDVLMRLFGG